MFTEQDTACIRAHGLTPEAVERQLENFRRGFPFLKVVRAAAPGDGILVPAPQEVAAAAGRAAVRYLAQGETAERHEIPVTFEGGIRYTVPASIDPKLAADDLVLRFRVGGVMKKRVVKLLLDDDAVLTRRRPVMAPGEMEELKLTKDMLDAHPGLTRIHITVEEA